MCLEYTVHSIWDSSHEQIGRTQTKREKKKKKEEGAKRHFKFQAENCPNLSVSQCVSLFLNNMRLIYK